MEGKRTFASASCARASASLIFFSFSAYFSSASLARACACLAFSSAWRMRSWRALILFSLSSAFCFCSATISEG